MGHDILIVDDERDICTLIAGILEDEGNTARRAHNSTEAMDAVRQRRPALIILDVWLQGSELDGLQILEVIRREDPPVPVVMISGHGTIDTAVSAIKTGAYDFIEKPFADEVLLAAIRTALERGVRTEQADSDHARVRAALASLSPREREVLNGLLAGHPNKTIAYDLGLSPRTVEVHRANVMTKMGASSLSELVRMTLLCQGA